MEDIIGMIAETEQKASDIKERAKARAAEIVTEAEKRAMEIVKASESECAALSAKIISEANTEADAAYEASLQKSRASATAYADSILEHVEPQVAAVVGRIVK